MAVSDLERKIYAEICRHDGIKAREIARNLGADRTAVNHLLYISPFMQHLCMRDNEYMWRGMVRQARPHTGIREFCGYYDSVPGFLSLSEKEWFDSLVEGCVNIGRSISDTRGLFHSFRDTREVMISLFADLENMGLSFSDWEIVFELRIRRSKYIRIFADVLVITDDHAFSLEFKMKDRPEDADISQAAKYCEYLEVIFGPDYDVIPALVLTKAEDVFKYMPLGTDSAELPVCSGDMLFNLFLDYLGVDF